MAVSVHSPAVIAEARLHGITELQAYYKLRARDTILRDHRKELSIKEGMRHVK
jgi:hypothetical protein